MEHPVLGGLGATDFGTVLPNHNAGVFNNVTGMINHSTGELSVGEFGNVGSDGSDGSLCIRFRSLNRWEWHDNAKGGQNNGGTANELQDRHKPLLVSGCSTVLAEFEPPVVCVESKANLETFELQKQARNLPS